MPKHRPKPISRAELARLKGVTRGAVSRAAEGALRPACLPGRRLGLAHPATRKWLGEADGAPTSGRPIRTEESAVSPAELAQLAGVPMGQLERDMDGPLRAARVPAGHVCARTFAQLAGASVEEVVAASRGELADAVTPTRRLDITHRSALEYMAARPFPRRCGGDPEIPEGYLAPACVGEDIDVTHPIAVVFLARCLGRLPTKSDLSCK